jgi:K+-sensing histidine kinase KdpD
VVLTGRRCRYHTLPANPQLYLPLGADAGTPGVVVEPSSARLLMIPEQRRLLDTFAALVAIALERIHFVSVAQDTLIKMESERLRNTLLAALSHDLRTPLTALVGLAETLYLDLTAAESGHADRASVLREQALRTSRMVNNLLEMARLQSGEVKPRKDWQSMEEIVGGALKDWMRVAGSSSICRACRWSSHAGNGQTVNLLENAINTPRREPHRRERRQKRRGDARRGVG